MKWAHIINISILFDCPPNKSQCSNKQKALHHCLPLSGSELLTLHSTIYYRHLSRVTDKHCDGCMILLCQNGFISPLQATISTALMSCAYSLPSDFLSFPLLFFPHRSDGIHCEPFPPLRRPRFTRTQCIPLFTDLVIFCTFRLPPIFPVYLLMFLWLSRQCLSVLAGTCRWLCMHVHPCISRSI